MRLFGGHRTMLRCGTSCSNISSDFGLSIQRSLIQNSNLFAWNRLSIKPLERGRESIKGSAQEAYAGARLQRRIRPSQMKTARQINLDKGERREWDQRWSSLCVLEANSNHIIARLECRSPPELLSRSPKSHRKLVGNQVAVAHFKTDQRHTPKR